MALPIYSIATSPLAMAVPVEVPVTSIDTARAAPIVHVAMSIAGK